MTEITLGQNIESKDYYSISNVNDKGVFITKKVQAGTEGSTHVKVTTQNGSEFEKWVFYYPNIKGVIKTVQYSENSFGEGNNKKIIKSVNVHFDDDKTVLSFSLDSRYASDFLKKLPNININEPVKFTPFDFLNEKGKSVKGVTIEQDEQKIDNFYWDKENKVSINGMIEPDEYDKENWKIFALKVDQFLLKELKKRFLQEPQIKVSESRQSPNHDEIGINEIVKSLDDNKTVDVIETKVSKKKQL